MILNFQVTWSFSFPSGDKSCAGRSVGTPGSSGKSDPSVVDADGSGALRDEGSGFDGGVSLNSEIFCNYKKRIHNLEQLK